MARSDEDVLALIDNQTKTDDDVLRLLGGGVPAQEAAPAKRGAAKVALETFGESALLNQPGEAYAKRKVATNPLEFAQFMFPKLGGRTPTAKDIEEAAGLDRDVRNVWESLKARRSESLDLARSVHGAKPDWKKIGNDYERANLESEVARLGLKPSPRGKKPAEKLDPRGPPVINVGDKFKQRPPEVMAPVIEESDYDRQLAEITKSGRERMIPGLNREPLSEEEIVSALLVELQERASQEIGELPMPVRAVAQGAGHGVRMAAEMVPAGKALRGAGAVGRAIAPAVEGAVGSVGDQMLEMASGARKSFSAGDIVREAALMGLGAKAGRALAARFPSVPKTAATVGMLGSVEVTRAAIDAATTGKNPLPQGDDWLNQFAEGFIRTAASVGVAGALGAAADAEPVKSAKAPKAAEKAPARPVEAPKARAEDGGPVMAAEAPAKPVEAAQEPGSYRASTMTGDALRSRIRQLLKVDDSKVKTQEYTAGAINEMLPKQIDLMEAELKVADWLDKTAGKDKALRALLDDITTKRVEAGDKIPVPDVVPPEVLAEGVRLKEEFAKKTLPFGEKLMDGGFIPEAIYRKYKTVEEADAAGEPQDFAVKKSDFDAGKTADVKMPFGKIKPGVPVSRDAAARGEYGELVGGFEYMKQQGKYLPQTSAPESIRDQVMRAPSKFQKPTGTSRAPAKDKLTAAHLQRRQMDFADAFASRDLDTSTKTVMEVMRSEMRSARNISLLEQARKDGAVRTEAELPNASEREAALVEAYSLEKEIAAHRKLLRSGDLNQLGMLQAKDAIIAMESRVKELKDIANEGRFKKAEGKEWGEYNGMYMLPHVMREASGAADAQGDWSHVFTAVHNNLKGKRVATNLAMWVPDTIGNWFSARMAGLTMKPVDISDAIKREFKRTKRDRLDLMFDSLVESERSALGGPTDISTRDAAELSRVNKAIKQRDAEGRGAGVLKFARFIETLGQAPGKIAAKAAEKGIPGVPTALKGVQKLSKFSDAIADAKRKSVDLAYGRAIFRKLMTEGVDGSGPMKPADAFHYVQRIMDYKTLPRAIQGLANFFSMVRYPSKVVEQVGVAMERRPTIFGKVIKTPLDKIIEADPTSTDAQKALIKRGLLRMAISTAKYVAPVAAMAAAARRWQSISKDEVDRAIDQQYEYLPPHARELTKMMAIPMGRDSDGDIRIFDVSRFLPVAVAMRYFWINFDDSKNMKGGARAVFEVAQKNMITGPAASIISGRRFTGDSVKEGFGPGERWWPAIEAMIPALYLNPMRAYFEYERVPESERNALLQFAKSGVGLPINVVRRPDFWKAALSKLYSDEILGVEQRDDGSWNYYPAHPEETPEGIVGRQFLNEYAKFLKELPQTEVNKIRKKIERLEAVGD